MLKNMVEAQALRRPLGFRPIRPYYDNPLPDAGYIELILR
jgi:hypothetical protein